MSTFSLTKRLSFPWMCLSNLSTMSRIAFFMPSPIFLFIRCSKFSSHTWSHFSSSPKSGYSGLLPAQIGNWNAEPRCALFSSRFMRLALKSLQLRKESEMLMVPWLSVLAEKNCELNVTFRLMDCSCCDNTSASY